MWWSLSSLFLLRDGAFPKICTLHFCFCSEINSSLVGKSFWSPFKKIRYVSFGGGGGCPILFHWTCFIGAKVVFGSLNVEQRFEAARRTTWPWGKGGAWTKGREGDSGIFSLINLPFFLEILPLGWCLAPEQSIWHELKLWSSLFFPFLVTTSWEQANGSRVACCQYRLQKSVSSQTGSEIGGGSYRFLRLFLVSFSELVWFRLVRYYFELGWDKHIPLVHQMLSAASQFSEAPGLTFLGAQECPGRG